MSGRQAGAADAIGGEVIEALVDAATLGEARAVLAALGLSVEDAIGLFLARIAEDKALPEGFA